MTIVQPIFDADIQGIIIKVPKSSIVAFFPIIAEISKLNNAMNYLIFTLGAIQ